MNWFSGQCTNTFSGGVLPGHGGGEGGGAALQEGAVTQKLVAFEEGERAEGRGAVVPLRLEVRTAQRSAAVRWLPGTFPRLLQAFEVEQEATQPGEAGRARGV